MQNDALPSLDERLAAAADFVKTGAVAADIGCDHGKLTLALSQKCKRVIAVDLRPAPLANAVAQMQKHSIQNVECRLGDGLLCLVPNEADTIVVAGLSAKTITGILAGATWVKAVGCRLVLAPATKPHELRLWLYKNGFDILQDKPVLAAGRYYAVICAEYTGEEKTISLYESVRGKVCGEQAEGYLKNQAGRLLKTSLREGEPYKAVALQIMNELEGGI